MDVAYKIAQLVPLLLPSINLVHFYMQQSSDGFVNAFIAAIHACGNPIDAIWGILCRQEVIRRNYIFSVRHFHDVPREMTAMLSTYDQWHQDPRVHFVEYLTSRQNHDTTRSKNHFPCVSEDEKKAIRIAAMRLRSCRTKSQFGTHISITTYVTSLLDVGYKILRGKNQIIGKGVSPVLSMIAMFSHLEFIIYLNGSVGSFSYPEEAVRILFELSSSVGISSGHARSRLAFLPDATVSGHHDQHETPCSNWTTFCHKLNRLGICSGPINCLRLPKPLFKSDGGRHSLSLLTMSISALLVSFFGAIAIPLLEAATTSRPLPIGDLLPFTGCLILWVTNWLLLVTATTAFRSKWPSIKRCAWIIIASDVLFMLAIVACFAWSYLRPSHIPKPIYHRNTKTIVLWFVSTWTTLVAMLALMFCATYAGENARLAYIRTSDETLADGAACA